MKQILTITIILTILILGDQAAAQEISYPAGSNIQIGYSLNFDTVAVGDTLVIERKVINSETFNLSGLYFSENLPPDFEHISESIKVNGTDISYTAIAPVSGGLISGFEYYNWLIDSPLANENAQYEMKPGDTLSFRLKLICNNPGVYTLPTHSTVMFGDGSALFSTSDPIQVAISTDNSPPSDIVDLTVE